MAVSQNGYTANNRTFIASYTIPGTSQKIALRKGDVSYILLYVLVQFHKRVEPLVLGWNWGYAERPVRGGTTLSNHASGTAVDANAPRHPLGKRGTFSAAQVREIRKILAEVGGVVRWGGDYKSRADEMHFEIIAGSSAVTAAANRLRGKPVTVGSNVKPPTTAKPTPQRRNSLMFVTRYGRTAYRLVTGDRIVGISATTYSKLAAAGVPAVALDNAEVEALESVLVSEK